MHASASTIISFLVLLLLLPFLSPLQLLSLCLCHFAPATLSCRLLRAQYDRHSVGPAPEKDVLVVGIKEGLSVSLLREAGSKCGAVLGVRVHRHPKTKAFLGAATITYARAGDGKKAVCVLDKSTVGGCCLEAELDDRGERFSFCVAVLVREWELRL